MNNNEFLDKVKQIYIKDSEANMQYISLWTEEIIFSWRWWVSVILTFLPWILWAIFRKKDSSARLMGVGFFTMFLTAWMDFIGVDLGLWYYPIDTIPFVPSYIPYDFCVLPVMVMFLIQYKPRFSPFWKAVFFTIINTIIAEPLLEYLEFYEENNWSPQFSLVIYFGIYLLASWLNGRKSYNPVA